MLDTVQKCVEHVKSEDADSFTAENLVARFDALKEVEVGKVEQALRQLSKLRIGIVSKGTGSDGHNLWGFGFPPREGRRPIGNR